MLDLRHYIASRPLYPPPPDLLFAHRNPYDMLIFHADSTTPASGNASAACFSGFEGGSGGGGDGGTGRWPRQETLTLLEIRSRLDPKFKEANQKGPLWDEVSRNEALRVAFIDVVETLKEGKVYTEYFSKLVKADINGKDKEIYSIKLPGNPKLGEGKPENQNHVVVFTRGNAVQTIDMNQDNYFEEALKMRNLLEEFHCDHGLRPLPFLVSGSTCLLEVFLHWHPSCLIKRLVLVTLGRRVLANPLKVRMHYGHPDVFDRVFHITRGGISKASRVINISKDIYSGR